MSTFVGNLTNAGKITATTGISILHSTIGGAIVEAGTINATSHGILIDSASKIVAAGTAIDIIGGSLTGGIANSGTVSGSVGIDVTGAHGVGVFDAGVIVGTGGTAVALRTAANTFTLESGYSITGLVIGSGGNTFQLGGTGAATFNLSSIGSGAQTGASPLSMWSAAPGRLAARAAAGTSMAARLRSPAAAYFAAPPSAAVAHSKY